MADVLTYPPEVIIESTVDYADLDIPLELQENGMCMEMKLEIGLFLMEFIFELLGHLLFGGFS
jgi:hypothetical protein